MKVLDFIISGQKLQRDPSCDFSGIVAGSRGYLFARFRFSAAWAGCKKVAVFSCKGNAHPVQLANNMCEIPAEALTGTSVQVYVVGRRSGYEITSGEIAFAQTVHH